MFPNIPLRNGIPSIVKLDSQNSTCKMTIGMQTYTNLCQPENILVINRSIYEAMNDTMSA